MVPPPPVSFVGLHHLESHVRSGWTSQPPTLSLTSLRVNTTCTSHLLGCLPNPGRLSGAVGSLVQVFTRLPWMSQSFRSLDLVPKIHGRAPSDWWLRCRTIFVFLKFMINCFQASYVLFQGRRLFFFPFSIYMQWNVQILREQVHEFWVMTNVHPYITQTLMAQWVKSPPAMQETQEMWVRALVQEDPLEKNMATCSSLLAWKIPRTGVPVELQSKGSHRVVYNWATKRTHTSQDTEHFHQPGRFLVPPSPRGQLLFQVLWEPF